MLYVNSANPTWTDRFPVFYLSFECCQSCKVFYFSRYEIPDFRSEIWNRLFAFSTWSTLNFAPDWCLKLQWFSAKWKFSLILPTVHYSFWTFQWLISGGFFRESQKSYLFQEVLQKYIGDHYIQFLKHARVFYLFYG